jgi:hypothetical protein
LYLVVYNKDKKSKEDTAMKYTLTINRAALTINTTAGTISGDTYPARPWIKETFKTAAWDGASKAWRIDPAELETEITKYAERYRRIGNLQEAITAAAPAAPAHNPHTGPCPHCGTYCYGECDVARRYR